MRIKFLAKGNNWSLWLVSNSQLTYYELDALPAETRPPVNLFKDEINYLNSCFFHFSNLANLSGLKNINCPGHSLYMCIQFKLVYELNSHLWQANFGFQLLKIPWLYIDPYTFHQHTETVWVPVQLYWPCPRLLWPQSNNPGILQTDLPYLYPLITLLKTLITSLMRLHWQEGQYGTKVNMAL